METPNKFLLNRKKNCKICNITYKPKSNNSKYCSVNCANKVCYKRKLPTKKLGYVLVRTKNCKICNKIYNTKSGKSVYCSNKCESKFRRTTDKYKKWYEVYKNSEKYKQSQLKYKNSGKSKISSVLYREKNREKIKLRRKKYYSIEKNRIRKYQLDVFHCALRDARKRQRTPKWLSKKEKFHIKIFYLYRPKNCHVDHILPLAGKKISGLHTLKNLQYLTKEDNENKNNKFEPYHV
jgi:hypothetical protein